MMTVKYFSWRRTWPGVGVLRLGGLKTGVGEAGWAGQHSGARVFRPQRSRQISSTERSGARVVQAVPAPVLTARPAAVGVVLLDCVHTGGLLLRLHLYLGPGEGAGHGGAEEDVDTEHDEEEDAKHHTEPQ